MATSDPRPAAQGSSERRKKLVLLLVSLAFSLLMAEGGIRIMKRHVPFQPDPDLLRSLRPNTVTPILTFESEANLNGAREPSTRRPVFVGYNNTNNIGFRMDEDVGPKQPGERRVLLLGDSFTEAEQVTNEQRFSYLVNKQLREETAAGPVHHRLLNGGIQNGSPAQYVLQLRKWLPEVQPDVVIVALAPNEVVDDLLWEWQYGLTFDDKGAPLAPKAQSTLGALRASYLLRYFHVFLQQRSPRGLHFFFPPESPSTPLAEVTNILCREHAPTRALFEKKTGAYLRAMKRMAEGAGARFGVLLVQYMWTFDDEPYDEGLYPDVARTMKDCYASHGRSYDEYIEAFLRDAAIPFQNPRAALLRAKAENPRRKLWHYVDYHYSPAGHRVIAGELHALLRPLM
jgi:hypothetical protein